MLAAAFFQMIEAKGLRVVTLRKISAGTELVLPLNGDVHEGTVIHDPEGNEAIRLEKAEPTD